MKKILPILVVGILVFSGISGLAAKIETKEVVRETINKNIEPEPLADTPDESEFDLVIIAPKTFSNPLQKLVEHKKDTGIKTKLKTTEEIYEEYEQGVDKPEQIKYFIKYALENWNISYVLLVGGLKSLIWAIPREEPSYGAKHWHVPVRYTNTYDNPKYPLLSSENTSQDPGVISDLYYADIYTTDMETGIVNKSSFEDWNSVNDSYFAAWNHPNKDIKDDDVPDLIPDVALGRLACRNKREVRTVVNKIIDYETNTYGKEWFNKTMVFSGDGFLDQQPIDIQWNTNNLSNGKYTIIAQSFDKDGIGGKLDSVTITLDKTKKSKITHNHDDHLQIDSYPGTPIAEITTPSNGDILGNTDVHYAPNEEGYGNAYDNEFSGWANVTYENGTMHINGKSYDPSPYGMKTSITVWVKDENGSLVFNQTKSNLITIYEGEWVTGEKELNGRTGALGFMPENFKKEIYWASNGKLKDPYDVINALNKGCGFAFFSGHGSPNVWADHFPGIPGDRRNGSFDGLYVTSLKPYPKFVTRPIAPMNKLKNNGKLPVVVVGGCHNSQFNVSLIPSFMHYVNKYFRGKDTKMWTYGAPVTECFNWKLISIPRRGAIATIGNTGLGYGRVGLDATSGGGDAWITIEFFKQYGQEGQTVLGDTHLETIKSYVNEFYEDVGILEEGHAKTVQQWVLLGDPSLRLGGITSS